jgi:hypothetical protein
MFGYQGAKLFCRPARLCSQPESAVKRVFRATPLELSTCRWFKTVDSSVPRGTGTVPLRLARTYQVRSLRVASRWDSKRFVPESLVTRGGDDGHQVKQTPGSQPGGTKLTSATRGWFEIASVSPLSLQCSLSLPVTSSVKCDVKIRLLATRPAIGADCGAFLTGAHAQICVSGLA